MNEQQETGSLNITDNFGYSQASTLQIRLDTTPIIENIEIFLRGLKFIPENADGKIIITKKTIGRPKANEEGCQAILNYVSSIVNPQVVSGNFSSDGKGYSKIFEDYIFEVHVDLATIIMVNLYDWDIKVEDYDLIVDFIMKLIIPFITRLIDNKERESYVSTIRHVSTERNLEQEPFRENKSIFNLLKPK